jgi:cytochrome c oxidase subunit 2
MRWLFHPASTQGSSMAFDWYVFLACGIAVGLYVYGAILWCLWRYRRRPGREAAKFHNNPPLELTYVAIPLLLVTGLFYLTWKVEVPIDAAHPAPAYRVAVTAFRWSWEFAYPGTGIRTIGTPMHPPTLYLPVRRTTEIDVTSLDVTHSFWVPAFLFKRDAIPGFMNRFDVTPSRVGDFQGRCAQFCGLDHALMTFKVRVVADAAYDRFLASGGATVP